MKKLLELVILIGFVIMLGAAGSADYFGMGFAKLLMLELCGMFVTLFGTSALLHYKRYVRRMMKKRACGRAVCRKNVSTAAKLYFHEKELC